MTWNHKTPWRQHTAKAPWHWPWLWSSGYHIKAPVNESKTQAERWQQTEVIFLYNKTKQVKENQQQNIQYKQETNLQSEKIFENYKSDHRFAKQYMMCSDNFIVKQMKYINNNLIRHFSTECIKIGHQAHGK